MRITLPAAKINVLRSAYVGGSTVRLIERKLNQNPTYFVTWQGVALNVGKRKHAVRKFNEYAMGQEVKTLGA